MNILTQIKRNRKRTRYKNGRERNSSIFLTGDKEQLDGEAIDVGLSFEKQSYCSIWTVDILIGHCFTYLIEKLLKHFFYKKRAQ
jgi:hypothetical protein